MNHAKIETPQEPTDHEPKDGLMRGSLARLVWLPIPLLLAAIIAARVAGLNESYESRTLTLILSLIFYTLVSLGTLFLVSRSFLATGKPGFLMLACGVILWSLAGTVGDAVSHGNANINVTIFNTGILLAGICHLAGATLTFRQQRTLRSTSLWLAAGCMLALLALGLITWFALRGWLPVFFIPGQGGTTVRFWVLISAIAMFALSAALLLSGNRRNRPHFTSWYARALLLLSVGLFGVMIQLSLGSVVNWLGRTAQWLGGLYLFLSALAALRGSGLTLLPRREQPHPSIYRYLVAVVAVIAAIALRLTFLSSLGTQSPFLTFYPAVVIAALYGGLWAGLLATLLSGLAADYFWIGPGGLFFFDQPSDWVTLFVFYASCTLISIVTEKLHSARARAFTAEKEALFAIERMEAADRLRETETRYTHLFETMTEGFSLNEIICDETGKPCDLRYIAVNPAFERHTGLKAADVVTRTILEMFPKTEPVWFERYGKVALTGEPERFEAKFGPLNRWFDVMAFRTEPMRFAVLFMDVTERKRAEAQREAALAALALSEEKFSKAFAINPAAIALTRLEDGLFIEVNDTWVKLNGYNRDEVIGQSARQLSIWPTAEEANRFVQELQEKGSIRGWEQQFQKKSGEIFIAEVSAQVLTFQGETVILSTLVDITARKQAEDRIAKQTTQLQERTAQLEIINKELESFSYSVSHDLRAPLRAIDGFSRMILKKQSDNFDEETKTKFNVIRENAQKMGQLIDDLLNLSRMGKQKMAAIKLDMAGLVQEVWKDLQVINPERPIELTVKELPEAYGDRTLIRQVYLNLLGNAIKFTKQCANANIETGGSSSGNEQVYYIKDNGAGFDMAYYDKLFGVFQRLHSTDDYEGTGIGLAIVQRIIHRHGGKVWAEAEEGKGATFYFTLPCA
jgi:PAS domain S-box-containing protein